MLQGLKEFFNSSLDIASTRAELFVLELIEEKQRLVGALISLVIGLVCMFMFLCSLCIFIAMLVWDTPYRLWCMGGVAVFFALCSIIAICVVRAKFSKVPFPTSIDMLKEDVAKVKNSSGSTEVKQHG